jgi:hypothetical protein
MAVNNNQITAPRVEFLGKDGKISREWYMFLYNLYALVGTGTGVIPVTSGGTGVTTIPTNGQLLIGNGTGYTLNTLGAGSGISVTNGAGTITIANTGVLSFSGGTTGLTPVAAAVGVVVLGGTLIAANGGTGFASYAVGDLLYADTTTTLAKLADVATGNALISGGVGTAPSWGKIGLTTHVSGVLPIANGGTNGTATPTAGAVAYGSGTAYAFTAAGTTNQALLSAGAGTPTWNTLTSGTSILYGNGSGLFSNVTIGSGVSFVGGTLSATGTGGTVTSVTGTSPVLSSGGTTPDISLASGYGDTQNPYAAKTATYVLAGPTTGAAAVPTFRALASTDIPALSYVSSVTGTAPVVSSGGLNPAISMAAANTSTNGYLTSTDWNTFNNKQPAGTYVTSVAVASSNGFAGTSSGGATPTLTLTTSISGIIYGNGTALAAVTISAPLGYSAGTLSITQAGTASNGYLSSTDWNTFNNKQPAGTYVTAVSVASANGFAGTSSGGATPALTLSTTITGLLKGNGTAISAATSGTDYAPATSGTSILYGNGSGGFSNVTVGSGLSFSAGTLAATTSAPSAPVTKTADFTVAATDVWLINNKSGSTCTVTLPTASTNSGRVLYFQNYQTQTLVSASSNVVPLAGGSAATSILLASSGDSATLVSDGTNWLMTQYVPNNILLLG